MYLLDTNICVALIQGNSQARAEYERKKQECYVSTIVMAELYKGVYCSQRLEQNLDTVNRFLRKIQIVEFDKNASEEFGKIQSQLRRIGRPTGVLDAVIAAVARSRGDMLVTNNTRDFINIPVLELENWLAE